MRQAINVGNFENLPWEVALKWLKNKEGEAEKL